MAHLSMLVIVFALGLLGLQITAVPYKAARNQTILPRTYIDIQEVPETPDLIDPDLIDAQYCFDNHPGRESTEIHVLLACNQFCTTQVIHHQEESKPTRRVEDFLWRAYDTFYLVRVEEKWPPSCGESGTVDFFHPKGPKSDDVYDCLSLCFGAWRQCWNNDGAGGVVTSGRVQYTMRLIA